MKLTELINKVDRWSKTKSLALAYEICEDLLADTSESAKERYGEPTMEGSE